MRAGGGGKLGRELNDEIANDELDADEMEDASPSLAMPLVVRLDTEAVERFDSAAELLIVLLPVPFH